MCNSAEPLTCDESLEKGAALCVCSKDYKLQLVIFGVFTGWWLSQDWHYHGTKPCPDNVLKNQIGVRKRLHFEIIFKVLIKQYFGRIHLKELDTSETTFA